MNIKYIPVGELQANCYIITNEKKEAILIDPGAEQEKIEKHLKDRKVVGILLTHNHFDHIGALYYFEQKYDLKHNDKINEFSFELLPTPGHSIDSLTFYFKEEKIMFTGDFLFSGNIGRMDLPTGSVEDMKKSLEKIAHYPDDITIYPGHGPFTTLEKEKKNFRYYF